MENTIAEHIRTENGVFQEDVTTVLEVTLDEIPFVKRADQTIWFSGDLTLTLIVDNGTGIGPLNTIAISDQLDNTKFKFIEGSVTAQLSTIIEPIVVTPLVLGTDFTVVYTQNILEDPTKDLLEIAFLAAPGVAASIPVGSIVTITFRGEKVPAA